MHDAECFLETGSLVLASENVQMIFCFLFLLLAGIYQLSRSPPEDGVVKTLKINN